MIYQNSLKIYLLVFCIVSIFNLQILKAEPKKDSNLNKKDYLTFDYRKRGFNIKMDSRIAVDGKRICFRNADRSGKNRCESIKNCQPRALGYISSELKKFGGDPVSKEQKLKKLQLLIDRGQIYAFKEATLSESEQAFEEAYKYAQTFDPELALDVLAMKGVVQMRLGEVKNCILSHNRDSCIFPLSKMAQHKDKSGSESALKTFYAYLDKRPKDDHIKWLVNIMHMTLGTYPKKVPEKYLVSLKKIQSEKEFPKMANFAIDVGFTEQANFGGVAVEDFNGDGYPEVLFGSLNQCEQIKYYQYNIKEKKFVNRAKELLPQEQLGAGLLLLGDYDNDGDIDIYVTRGAWHPGGREYPTQGGFAYNSLLENDGKGKFKDVTKEKGLRTFPNSTLSANWGDVNNDGWLDLFVSNESSESELFINRKGTFENYTSKSGIINNAIGKGTVLADLNNDGNLDLIISNYAAPNRVFFGKGDGSFEIFHQPDNFRYPEYGFPLAVFDYDNDGFQDLFMAAFAPDIDNFAKWLEGKPNKGEFHRMYKNVNGKKFLDVTKSLRLDRNNITMSLNFGDLNNDGFMDLYLGTGANSLGDLEPNHLYLNNNGKTFLDITDNARVGSLQKGHGVAFSDLNGDGLQEILLQQGGSSQGDRFFPALFSFEDPQFAENAFIELKLKGVKSNRMGMHSRIQVNVKRSKGDIDKIFAWVGATGSFGTNPLTAHIGLGKIEKIDSVVIDWAGSKTHQVLSDVAINKTYVVEEGKDKAEEVEVKKFSFKSSVFEPEEHTHVHN